jgi:hypothetical protein
MVGGHRRVLAVDHQPDARVKRGQQDDVGVSPVDDLPEDGVGIGLPAIPEEADNGLGWWEVIDGTWRWMTNPSPD